ncbi:MAG TPA: CCA tRNA nucleotidyltransferase [Herpetosiphon sp.]|uniref:Polynucleotide adenylyltransferase region n=1 Tax=Herpetosiphon aurantiacus (strain ATCC 23779 / DSM 785 / 114-95) TaxID=316274 RepID=A9B0E4_HERA2|nr:CCA tRNA nucleotidyltransferase [Herpetosiphon sp.]ABX05253.1 Polynucleotide adenylyltransferase region [Herpetosiphon aurantiacus DSM 785]HBW51237.1 CCA tRNA nucleotidyltransferase [Herpetosiphon sp.]
MLYDLNPFLRQASAELQQRLQWLIQTADTQGLACYLVGGCVRDWLLERPVGDIDIVVEGDAIMLAEIWATVWPDQLHIHPPFGTATLSWQDAAGVCSLDLISARSEYYPQPAALPVVSFANLAADLARRDFTINCLALRLANQPTLLIDPQHGYADLQQSLIRVLHDQSFIDDPTRILRAIRFAARLNFELEPQTATLLQQALPWLDQTTPARLWNELGLLLTEPSALAALSLADSWGVLGQLFGSGWSSSLNQQAEMVLASQPDQQLAIVWLLLMSQLSPSAAQTQTQRFSLAKPIRLMVEQWPELAALVATLNRTTLAAGQLDRLLSPFAPLLLEVWASNQATSIQRRIKYYLQYLRPIASALTGRDLQAQGIAAGPQYKTLLAEAREGQLDQFERENPNLC